MVSLKNIANYVDQMAHIIANVLQLDVLIVDRDLKIIGDSDLTATSESECIRKDSVLAQVIGDKSVLILDSKEEHPGCANCKFKQICLVEMIIGIPIFFEGEIQGSIGIIANTNMDKEKMLKGKEYYLKFIHQMIDLIVNKLKEERHLEEISLLQKRMEVVLDTVDQFLVLINKKGKILQTNLKFKLLFKGTKLENIRDIMSEECANQLLSQPSAMHYKEIKLDGHDFVVSTKPVIFNEKDEGALLMFRSLKDLALEMNALYAPGMDVVFEDLIGTSEAMNMVRSKIHQIANSSSTVLIEGETGTGKEVIARLIHNTSRRSKEIFVAINCSAIPEDLMESELFGYEEGAFSGARKGGKIGKFHLAHGGTIFLDEIGELPLHLQAKLLRVLQERKVTKIGGLESTDVDVRIIAATNKKLKDMVVKGQFREDLYYRVNVIPLSVPPLRDRISDIPILIEHFVQFYSERIEKPIKGVTSDAMEKLSHYTWRGNVRELRNVVEFAINMTTTDMITVDALPYEFREEESMQKSDLNIEEHVGNLIQTAINRYGNTTKGKEQAAEALGISVATLYRKLKETLE